VTNPIDPLPDAVGAGRTIARLSRLLERCSADAGLNLAQYRLLMFIGRAPQRAGALAEKDAVSGPSLTARIDALEAKGLVRRAPVPGDRRGVELAITDEGGAVLATIEACVERRLDALFPGPKGRSLLRGLAQANTLWESVTGPPTDTTS
jgi:DNA-binding MarR family transcriptional regulator